VNGGDRIVKKRILQNLTSRFAVLTAALLYSVLAICGSTFSWFTSADTQINEFSGETEMRFETLITEEFIPLSDVAPGQEVMKRISVYNSGTYDALIRITFEEILETHSTTALGYPSPDTQGVTPELIDIAAYSDWIDAHPTFTLDLPPDAPTDLVVKIKESTAAPGQYQKIAWLPTDDATKGHLVSADYSTNGTMLTLSNVQYMGTIGEQTFNAAWGKQQETTPGTPLTLPDADDITHLITAQKLILNYAELSTATIETGQWFYNEADGYFYYIGKLGEASTSPKLLESLTLSSDAGTYYSGATLTLIVHLDGIQPEAAMLLDQWGLDSASYLYKALEPYCS
jgi:hypothetical protein